MKFAFCDDDHEITTLFQGYVETWAQEMGHSVESTGFSTSEDFLLAWTSPSMFDVVFLDIEMGQLSGIELAKVIRSISSDVSIVFITGHSEFALDGYSVDASSYLIKPVSQKAFYDCLNRLTQKISRDQSRVFFVEKNGQVIRFRHEEILYFEVRSHVLIMHTARGSIEFRSRMSDVENSLSTHDGFVRIHRSFLVNIKHVRAMDKTSLIMDNGTRLSISRSYTRETYNEYIRQNNN